MSTPQTRSGTGNSDPNVSVVIPAHNEADWISGAVDSALNQQFVSVEVIVVDDGSTDETASVVQPYTRNGYVRYIYQEQSGPWSARNTGIRSSSGRFIAFLDADDRWKPKKLSHQVHLLRDRPSVALTITNVRETTPDGTSIRIHRPQIPVRKKALIRHLFLGRISGVTSSILVRRSIVNRIGGFDASLRRRADHLFLMESATRGKVYRMDRVLVEKKDRPGSTGDVLDRSNPERAVSSQMPFINRSVKQFPFLAEYRNILLADLYQNALVLALRNSDRKSARSYAKKALQQSPLRVHVLILYLLLFIPVSPRYIIMCKRAIVGRRSSG